jgi:hypothetical protein
LHESNKRWGSDPARLAQGAAACVLLLCVHAHAQESLCAPDEAVVFACHVGAKMVALCRPPGVEPALAYRFGTPARVELAYAPSGRQARAAFTRSAAPLYGGGKTTVDFRRGQYQYSVYSKVGRSDGPDRVPEFEDGVIVSRRGKTIRKMACDDGGEGFRENLDWLPVAAAR